VPSLGGGGLSGRVLHTGGSKSPGATPVKNRPLQLGSRAKRARSHSAKSNDIGVWIPPWGAIARSLFVDGV
jgi:hypothetical protein